MAIKCKVKVKHGFKKVDKLVKELPQSVATGIEEVLKNLQCEAIRLERGHNQEGIIVDKVDLSTGKIKGRVYADPSKFMSADNTSYLWFEYFGTGAFAEQEHVGDTSHFIQSGYTEWFIPVDKAEGLNYPIITINNSQFYLAHGVQPNHFLTDAEFKTRQENAETVEKTINEMFKEVCK